MPVLCALSSRLSCGAAKQAVTKVTVKELMTDPEKKTDNPAEAFRERSSSTTLKKRVELSPTLKFTGKQANNSP